MNNKMNKPQGLMEDIQVPEGEFADMDLVVEHLVSIGMPAGMVTGWFERFKGDPAMQKTLEIQSKQFRDVIEKDPSLVEKYFGNSKNSEMTDGEI